MGITLAIWLMLPALASAFLPPPRPLESSIGPILHSAEALEKQVISLPPGSQSVTDLVEIGIKQLQDAERMDPLTIMSIISLSVSATSYAITYWARWKLGKARVEAQLAVENHLQEVKTFLSDIKPKLEVRAQHRPPQPGLSCDACVSRYGILFKIKRI